MARISKVEINHFRCINNLEWCPSPGINCLIGPGDSGKSTILDAIDLCLGARRNIQFTDADFYRMDVNTPISISVTIGELDDSLKSLETYGMFLRGFDAQSGQIEDEPENNAETVLTVNLTVSDNLEPEWSLVSDRAKAQGLERNLTWGDRVRIAPTLIGVMADYHLAWRRGSVLHRISDERADVSVALAKAAREIRDSFGEEEQSQFDETLKLVASTAKELGIQIGEEVKVLLDPKSVLISNGSISLHDERGIPLSGLGIGSTRLLIAGLQRKAAARSTIILIDELEYGLEPHRIIRFLGSLGAKESQPPLQVFMTTHSPVVVRELNGSQLFILRLSGDKHVVLPAGNTDEIQGTLRRYPEAFLASSIIVCEGSSEVGLIRGLDQFRTVKGHDSIFAKGTSLVDCGGADKLFKRAKAFHLLGYQVAVIRDDDKRPDGEEEFIKSGKAVFTWGNGRALEDELFLSLTDDGVLKLVELAVELLGDNLVDEHIKSVSNGTKTLNSILDEAKVNRLTEESRKILARAAKTKNNSWFKSVTIMENVAHDIIGPDLDKADDTFRDTIEQIFKWVSDGND